jgi:hypothetical protein
MSDLKYTKEKSKVKRYLKLAPFMLIPVVSFYLAGKLDDVISKHLSSNREDPVLEELCRKHEYMLGTNWIKMSAAFCYKINHNEDGSFKKEFLDYFNSRKDNYNKHGGSL